MCPIPPQRLQTVCAVRSDASWSPFSDSFPPGIFAQQSCATRSISACFICRHGQWMMKGEILCVIRERFWFLYRGFGYNLSHSHAKDSSARRRFDFLELNLHPNACALGKSLTATGTYCIIQQWTSPAGAAAAAAAAALIRLRRLHLPFPAAVSEQWITGRLLQYPLHAEPRQSTTQLSVSWSNPTPCATAVKSRAWCPNATN
jgi:hypothetical protein